MHPMMLKFCASLLSQGGGWVDVKSRIKLSAAQLELVLGLSLAISAAQLELVLGLSLAKN